jgi:acetyl-CoA carboxylase biotin carboxylase subunit
LIREQILVAAGVPISGKNYLPQLHAIEVRINAEDPYNDFVRHQENNNTSYARGHGVRLDTHVYSGYTIPPNDSMIAVDHYCSIKSRSDKQNEKSFRRIFIEGIKTTIPFHRQLMDDPRYIAGDYTTAFMDTFKMDDL